MSLLMRQSENVLYWSPVKNVEWKIKDDPHTAVLCTSNSLRHTVPHDYIMDQLNVAKDFVSRSYCVSQKNLRLQTKL